MGTPYRTCSQCGANLDPGERCDCLGVREIKIVSPERNAYGSAERIAAPTQYALAEVRTPRIIKPPALCESVGGATALGRSQYLI